MGIKCFCVMSHSSVVHWLSFVDDGKPTTDHGPLTTDQMVLIKQGELLFKRIPQSVDFYAVAHLI
jgi:hypothetical protein